MNPIKSKEPASMHSLAVNVIKLKSTQPKPLRSKLGATPQGNKETFIQA